MQIQISWLLQKPTDLDLHCLQMQGISGFSRTRVKKMQMNLSALESHLCLVLPMSGVLFIYFFFSVIIL